MSVNLSHSRTERRTDWRFCTIPIQELDNWPGESERREDEEGLEATTAALSITLLCGSNSRAKIKASRIQRTISSAGHRIDQAGQSLIIVLMAVHISFQRAGNLRIVFGCFAVKPKSNNNPSVRLDNASNTSVKHRTRAMLGAHASKYPPTTSSNRARYRSRPSNASEGWFSSNARRQSARVATS